MSDQIDIELIYLNSKSTVFILITLIEWLKTLQLPSKSALERGATHLYPEYTPNPLL